MLFSIRKGYDPALPGAPRQSVEDAAPVGSAAILGADCPGLRPALAVAAGDPVRRGQVLFTDRRHPAIAYVSPLTGVVEAIDFGPRRTLSAMVLRRTAETGPEDGAGPPAPTGDARETLLARGLWPAFLARPFGRVPAPDGTPVAILVSATDSNPLAPDPRVVLADRRPAFDRGLTVLAALTAGPVFVAQPPGAGLAAAAGDRIRAVEISGPHPAGLPGAQLYRLRPEIGPGKVWTIGYQDVAAIGHLFATGDYRSERVVALGGPRARDPRLVRTIMGASLRDLTSGEVAPGGRGGFARILSGSVLAGREAAWLGRHHHQVTILDARPEARRLSLPRWLGRSRRGPRPLIASERLEGLLPFGIPPVPLMRALAVGDSETAERLGALDLVEEDVALLSCFCTSGADYGRLLRRVLDELAEAA
ncbi:MAG TPA: hypothetical protein PKA33_01875 [Amaricoccus sp.]|uniref:hypothetical protein n=1 Tax=Amaricoccus sp. TaxID=1872485 RepID=UPI002B9AAE6A|nr:hypothetical protein [Amaricoccus sp.]HMQ93617.1 hypothetical protein [Amaricoccus sp.]HMR51157.1 hypothetical protein [Amaricoccus sp.]HMR62300.1 hypothetical protein [Amaricoccus sp.]HMT98095.1 hypothetical protein [Amaricoccus sp.]